MYAVISVFAFDLGIRDIFDWAGGPQSTVSLGMDPTLIYSTNLRSFLRLFSYFILAVFTLFLLTSLVMLSKFPCYGYRYPADLRPFAYLSFFASLFASFEAVRSFLWKFQENIKYMEVRVRLNVVINGLNKIFEGVFSRGGDQSELEELTRKIDLHFRKLNEYLAMHLSRIIPSYSHLKLRYLGREFSFKKVKYNEFESLPYYLGQSLPVDSIGSKFIRIRDELSNLRECLRGKCRPDSSQYMRDLWKYLSSRFEIPLRKLFSSLGLVYYLILLPSVHILVNFSSEVFRRYSQFRREEGIPRLLQNVPAEFSTYLAFITIIAVAVLIFVLIFTLLEIQELPYPSFDKFVEKFLLNLVLYVAVIVLIMLFRNIFTIIFLGLAFLTMTFSTNMKHIKSVWKYTIIFILLSIACFGIFTSTQSIYLLIAFLAVIPLIVIFSIKMSESTSLVLLVSIVTVLSGILTYNQSLILTISLTLFVSYFLPWLLKPSMENRNGDINDC